LSDEFLSARSSDTASGLVVPEVRRNEAERENEERKQSFWGAL